MCGLKGNTFTITEREKERKMYRSIAWIGLFAFMVSPLVEGTFTALVGAFSLIVLAMYEAVKRV